MNIKEVEPRVLTEDVSLVLHRIVRPDSDDTGESVSIVAAKAETSTRTVYRILSNSTYSISLDLADRLCIAADSHVGECRLVYPDGRIVGYFD